MTSKSFAPTQEEIQALLQPSSLEDELLYNHSSGITLSLGAWKFMSKNSPRGLSSFPSIHSKADADEKLLQVESY